jgi:hypothetical protein
MSSFSPFSGCCVMTVLKFLSLYMCTVSYCDNLIFLLYGTE